MAYNTSKGPRKFGDLINEGDVDTHIDWDDDTIRLRTNNLTRVSVENTQLSCSTGAHIVGNLTAKGSMSTSGSLSGSSTLHVVGATSFGAAVAATGSITAGTSFIIGSADINETDLEKLDGITDGTVTANKALVVDGSKNIATLGTVGCGAITSTGASKFGSISGSSTLHVVGATSFGAAVAATGSVTAGTSFIIGSADLNETDLEKIDGITNGTVAANKAVVVDGSLDFSGYRNISGSGTLQAAGNAYIGATLKVTGSITTRDDILPFSDNTKNLGSAAKRWANVYTADLHLRNDRGDWTVIEEEEYLSLRNNKTGKRYKLSMEEID